MLSYNHESIFSIDSKVCRETAEANLSTVRQAFGSVELDQYHILEFGFYPFSNDKLSRTAASEIIRADYKPGGIALFVGPGGVYSFLPYVKPDLPLVVDKDRRTLEFQKQLGEIIVESVNFEGVKELLVEESKAGRLDSLVMSAGVYRDKFADEINSFGSAHWSQNFFRVREQLAKSPPVFIAADLNDASFAEGLQNLSANTGDQIKFANFTNVAHWQKTSGISNSFAEGFPLGKGADILYSDRLPDGDPGLQLRRVSGLERYLRAIGDSTTPESG